VRDYSSGFNYFKKNNVIVLRTFSKAYGLAGLRIGYAIASSYFSGYMERVRQPFNVNLLAQAGALAALDDDRFLKKVKQANAAGKAYLYRELDKLGLKYIPSVTNFILVNAGCDGFSVFKAMLKKGVIIRDMRQYGLNQFFRVTIGTEKENKLFIRSLKECLVNGGHS
jgi:histidinol-phosphate aminotransferase